VTTTTNAIVIDAPPESVFAVLDDPCAYPRWVVGTRRIRDVDEAWPAEGARFFHAVGVPEAELHDWSRIRRREPPHHLVLDARFRPTGTARVEIDVDRVGTRSRVEMRETPEQGPVRRVPGALLGPLLWVRNWISLQRLRHEVERRDARTAEDRA